MNPDAVKALNKAKVALMSTPNSAFITTVCFSVKHAWDESIPTAATDGKTIWFNPTSYLMLSPGQRVSRLLHETWHIALQHMGRLAERDTELWNMAADYYINLMLVDAGFEKISTWLFDEKYRGMSSDEIYQLLNQQKQENPDSAPQMNPDEKDIKHPGSPDFDNEVADILIRASIQSKIQGDTPGSIPGDIQVFLDSLLNPVLPWHQIFRRFMNAQAKEDYSWRRPNKRYAPDHYLPSLYSESLGEIAMAMDMSGSVSDAESTRYASEAHAVLKKLKPEKLSLIQFDTQIRSVNALRSFQELKNVEFHGRGGTSIYPVIEWARNNKPRILVIFSDGEFYHDPDDPKVNIVWVIHNNPNFTAPYGKVIHFTV